MISFPLTHLENVQTPLVTYVAANDWEVPTASWKGSYLPNNGFRHKQKSGWYLGAKFGGCVGRKERGYARCIVIGGYLWHTGCTVMRGDESQPCLYVIHDPFDYSAFPEVDHTSNLNPIFHRLFVRTTVPYPRQPISERTRKISLSTSRAAGLPRVLWVHILKPPLING